MLEYQNLQGIGNKVANTTGKDWKKNPWRRQAQRRRSANSTPNPSDVNIEMDERKREEEEEVVVVTIQKPENQNIYPQLNSVHNV